MGTVKLVPAVLLPNDELDLSRTNYEYSILA
jgi:hypothetical protein